MNINSTHDYILLMRRALESQILPEVCSEDGRSAAQIVLAILAELEKREGPTKPLLSGLITSGKTLIEEMSNFVNARDIDDLSGLPGGSSVGDLISAHSKINDLIARLASRLEELDGDERADALLRRAAEWEASYYLENSKVPLVFSNDSGPAEPPQLTEQHVLGVLSEAKELGADLAMKDFRPLPGGFGKQTYRALVVDGAGRETDLIIRKMDPNPIVCQGGCDLASEYGLLNSLAKTGFPAPQPFLFRAGYRDVKESFYVTRRVAGVAAGTYLEGSGSSVSASFYEDLARWLGTLHSYKLSTFADHIRDYSNPALLSGTASDAYRYAIEGWKEYLRSSPHLASPLLTWMISWLSNNIPYSDLPPVLVHGDYNVHNVLVDQGRLSIVLDWECAEYGFPEQDLAWLKPNLEKVYDWDRFLDIYVAAGGKKEIDSKAMAFSLVYASLRTNIAGNRATQNLQSGRNRDIRYAMVELGFTGSFMNSALEAGRV
ncbi:MAG: phosphotransferase family protein [Parvibaculaceae bacterium]